MADATRDTFYSDEEISDKIKPSQITILDYLASDSRYVTSTSSRFYQRYKIEYNDVDDDSTKKSEKHPTFLLRVHEHLSYINEYRSFSFSMLANRNTSIVLDSNYDSFTTFDCKNCSEQRSVYRLNIDCKFLPYRIRCKSDGSPTYLIVDYYVKSDFVYKHRIAIIKCGLMYIDMSSPNLDLEAYKTEKFKVLAFRLRFLPLPMYIKTSRKPSVICCNPVVPIDYKIPFQTTDSCTLAFFKHMFSNVINDKQLKVIPLNIQTNDFTGSLPYTGYPESRNITDSYMTIYIEKSVGLKIDMKNDTVSIMEDRHGNLTIKNA